MNHSKTDLEAMSKDDLVELAIQLQEKVGSVTKSLSAAQSKIFDLRDQVSRQRHYESDSLPEIDPDGRF